MGATGLDDIVEISMNESVKDQTKCPAIQGFVRSIPKSDRTLSDDLPLFAALRTGINAGLKNCTA